MDPNDNQSSTGQDSGNTDDSPGTGGGDQIQDQPQVPATPDLTTPNESPPPVPESNPPADGDSGAEEIAPPAVAEGDEPDASSNDGSSGTTV